MGQEFSLHLQKKTSEKRIEQVNNVYIYIYIFTYMPGTPNNHLKNGCLVKQPFFYIKIWNHPIETTIYKWLFGVPGAYIHTSKSGVLQFSRLFKPRCNICKNTQLPTASQGGLWEKIKLPIYAGLWYFFNVRSLSKSPRGVMQKHFVRFVRFVGPFCNKWSPQHVGY